MVHTVQSFHFDNRMVYIGCVIAARGLAASSINPRTLQEKNHSKRLQVLTLLGASWRESRNRWQNPGAQQHEAFRHRMAAVASRYGRIRSIQIDTAHVWMTRISAKFAPYSYDTMLAGHPMSKRRIHWYSEKLYNVGHVLCQWSLFYLTMIFLLDSAAVYYNCWMGASHFHWPWHFAMQVLSSSKNSRVVARWSWRYWSSDAAALMDYFMLLRLARSWLLCHVFVNVNDDALCWTSVETWCSRLDG